MGGRAWTFGAVRLNLVIHCAEHPGLFALGEFLGGIMDTLDGSSGMTFTYLPIVFEDDCQVCDANMTWSSSEEERYVLRIEFLEQTPSLPSTARSEAAR